MEKRTQARFQTDGAIKCFVEIEKGREEGRIHNISTQGALLETRVDFGISKLNLILDLEPIGETLTLAAGIRWHAVSPQNETDHYGLIFCNVDDDTQKKLDLFIQMLTEQTSSTA